jgi:uncharacterized membrane protein HdeD (DUF308 family)
VPGSDGLCWQPHIFGITFPIRTLLVVLIIQGLAMIVFGILGIFDRTSSKEIKWNEASMENIELSQSYVQTMCISASLSLL